MTNLAVSILKAGGIDGRDPEDGTICVLVAGPEGGLERDLGLANPTESFNGSPLAVAIVSAGGDSFEELR